ncbi:MAG: RNase adapter RapZ, partial [Oscillospiraceae bacterium]
ADLVFDVHCLPNPHYVDELRPLTGVDKPVSDYVFGFAQSREFYRRLTDLIEYALPLYVQEGKSHLVIAIGCTGGRHRSVAYAEALYRELNSKEILVTVSHRDSAR